MADSDDASTPSPKVADSGRVDRRANSVDAHVGARVRERRLALGFSLEELAKRIGVGAQQLQKYETGVNRISASRLYDVTLALGVPIAWFYLGIAERPAKMPTTSISEPPASVIDQLPELIGIFMQIKSTDSRQKLIELARILASPGNRN